MVENTYSGAPTPMFIAAREPVFPHLPEPLYALKKLSLNVAWAWVPGVSDVFARLDSGLEKGPVQAIFNAQNLNELAVDSRYVEQVRQAESALDRYLEHQGRHSNFEGTVAYFCAEYGLHETLPLYSGGLGILAGDHCKEASDLGLPFVAVGLFYRRGFFHQRIDWEGRQEHEYPVLDPNRLPLLRVLTPGTDELLTVPIEFPGRTVFAAVWLLPVGMVPLLLLDTDLPANAVEDRPITSQLYTSGRDMRLHQEIILGVGGVRALEALGIEPTVWHLNEGHSAFLLLERLRRGEAVEAVRDSSVLSIHTPVPAGNERFDAEHTVKVLSALVEDSPVDEATILKMGRDSVNDQKVFDMTAFALRLSRAANGVSKLHGKTADKTWRKVFGKPIIGVTNGVHMPTWLGPRVRDLLEKHSTRLSPETSIDHNDLTRISDQELWDAHQAQKQDLIAFTHHRIVQQAMRRGAGPEELAQLAEALNPDAFLIGFARRFATYKRAALLFSDERRLAKLLNDKDRPVQILFAGKAHPADRAGQKLIEKVYALTQKPKWRGKVFLLEDYDMQAGRRLVQGTDIWLNNPRRPLEASGTSGMKAAANGVPNVSVLDGWWDEAFTAKGLNGFAIGGRKVAKEDKAQDRSDAEDLYTILETEVIPRYFVRGTNGLPAGWLEVMRGSIATSLWAFSTARMIDDYVEGMYRG